MKKIWIGGYGACSNYNEKAMIKELVKNLKLEFVESEEADIVIITDTCLATYQQMINSYKCIEDI
ncbi:MAG: hypothetical protein HFH08_00155 [Bacilli bacterium]|nr:hypothetical protein [Bacilli bacterium]